MYCMDIIKSVTIFPHVMGNDSLLFPFLSILSDC